MEEMREQTGEDSKLVVAACGEMLVNESAAFRSILLESIERTGWLEVDCSGLTAADLTFFQILCAAHHTAMERDKRFTLTGHNTELFGSLAGSMGLDRHVGCVRDVCQSCIWTGGREQ